MPTALITGITGDDGSYLADLLLRRGEGLATSGILLIMKVRAEGWSS
jgi:GDP-D-mannose dehydratase